MEYGRLPSAPGHSAEPEPCSTVSALRASVPSAVKTERQLAVFDIHCLAHSAHTLSRQIIHMTLDGIRKTPRDRMFRAFIRDARKIRAIMDQIEGCAAQAIEARRAATVQQGAVEDESAVPQGCAQQELPDHA